MMETVRQYIISVISASIVCAVFKALAGKAASSKVVGLLCGMFMLFTFLGPVKDIGLPDLVAGFRWDERVTQEAIHKGEELTRSVIADIISAEIASYVEKKAIELGAEVSIEVELSNEEIPAPVGLEISGNVSPYIRRQLEAFISGDIGLKGEDVRWIGRH